MSFWTAVIILAAIVAVYSLKRNRDRLRYGRPHEGWSDEHAGRAREAALEREIQDLRERVKVLERIATDGRQARAIAEEIESLRDE